MILRRNGELDRSRMCPCSQDTKQPRAAFSLRGNTVNRHLKAAMTLTFILSKQELELSLHYHLICCGKSIIRVVFMYIVFTCLYCSPKNRTEKKFPHVSKKLFPLLSFLLLLLFYSWLSFCLSLPNPSPAPPASLLFQSLSPFPCPPTHPLSLPPSAPRRDSALTPARSLWASAPSSPRTLCLGAGPPKNCLHRHGRDPRPAGGPRHWAAGMPCCPIFPFLSITADGMGPEAASGSSSSSQSQRVL